MWCSCRLIYFSLKLCHWKPFDEFCVWAWTRNSTTTLKLCSPFSLFRGGLGGYQLCTWSSRWVRHTVRNEPDPQVTSWHLVGEIDQHQRHLVPGKATFLVGFAYHGIWWVWQDAETGVHLVHWLKPPNLDDRLHLVMSRGWMFKVFLVKSCLSQVKIFCTFNYSWTKSNTCPNGDGSIVQWGKAQLSNDPQQFSWGCFWCPFWWILTIVR